MNVSFKVAGRVAYVQNCKLKIKKFSFFSLGVCPKLSALLETKSAYLEQAKYCIDEYLSAISRGGELRFASEMLAKANYAVRQARAVDFYLQQGEKA